MTFPGINDAQARQDVVGAGMRGDRASQAIVPVAWWRDRRVWKLVGLRYVPWLGGLNLVWEIAQLPLYTVWKEATPGAIAFAVAHCTAGDMLIGSASLLLALVITRAQAIEHWRWRRIVTLMLILGPGYTIFSEWLNTTLFRWTYSELMPTISVAGVTVGWTPLLQWLLIPPLALHLTRRGRFDD
jgi:hypothetical protein